MNKDAAEVLMRKAEGADRSAVDALLKQAKLAALDARSQFEENYVIAAASEGTLVGVAGMEMYGSVGLLRSVAVAEPWRSRGLGRRLTEDRLQWAIANRVRQLFLLTTDAAAYWERYGFVRIQREEAPPAVAATSQWAGGCSATATAMRLTLRNDTKLKVIFACVHNAGRSQMAAAFFNQLCDPANAEALSAGTDPGDRIHPEVLAAMREVGLDLSGAKPARLTEELVANVQLLVTMGCGEQCPLVPGLRREDWPLRDPKGLPMDDVRKIRNDVRDRVRGLLRSEGLEAPRHPLEED